MNKFLFINSYFSSYYGVMTISDVYDMVVYLLLGKMKTLNFNKMIIFHDGFVKLSKGI